MVEPEPDSRPPAHETAAQLRCVEWCPVCRAADVLRETATPELRDQWQTVQREALMTMRAVIDSYLDRIDGAESAGTRMQDIPIE